MDKVTIVTVCYNAETVIEKTMRSVCEQDYPNIEYLVVDGASEDSTLAIAFEIQKEYDSDSSLTIKISSEKDRGIYDAMNKGVQKATGEWVLFLNAGDQLYESHTVSEVFQTDFAQNVDGVYGDTLRFHDDWSQCVDGKPLCKIATEIPLPFCHQSVFVRTRLLKEIAFDISYKLAADYNLFAQCYLKKCIFEHVGVIVSRYAMDGASARNTVAHLKEKIQIRERNGLEQYGAVKKWYMVSRLYCRQKLKQILPAVIVEKIRGY